MSLQKLCSLGYAFGISFSEMNDYIWREWALYRFCCTRHGIGFDIFSVLVSPLSHQHGDFGFLLLLYLSKN